MPYETKSTVSLEDLEKAADGLMETGETTDDETIAIPNESSAEENLGEEGTQGTEEESEEEEESPEEPTDHTVRSKLGRRVSAIETKIDSFIGEMRDRMKKDDYDEFDETSINPDEPLTLRQLEQYEAKKAKTTKQYNDDYNKQIAYLELETDDDTLHAEIMDEFLKNHNIKRSNNGKNDAGLNYLNAQSAVLKRSSKKPINPLKKNDEKNIKGLGTASESITDKTKGTPVKLDSDTKELIEYFRSTPGGESWTDEKVASIAQREPSARFSRYRK